MGDATIHNRERFQKCDFRHKTHVIHPHGLHEVQIKRLVDVFN